MKLSDTNSVGSAATGKTPRSTFIQLGGVAGAAAALSVVLADPARAMDNPNGPLRIVSDRTTTPGDGGCQLTIANQSRGADPAQTPVIGFIKDDLLRWQLGIDVTAGSQGDFFLLRYSAQRPQDSRDVIYITDELYSKVAINGDRYSPATLSIYGQVPERPVMHLTAAAENLSPMIQSYAANGITQLLLLDSRGLLVGGSLKTTAGGDFRIDVGNNAIRGVNNTSLQLYDGQPKLAVTASPAGGGGLAFGSTGAARISSADGNQLQFNKPVRDDSLLIANQPVPDKGVYVGYNYRTGQAASALTIGNDANLYRAGAGALKTDGSFVIGGKVGFYGSVPMVKPAVKGPTRGNTALSSLLTALSTLGLITNQSS